MPKVLDVDWAQVQAARSAGETIPSIQKRFGISRTAIRNHTKPASNGSRPKAKRGKIQSSKTGLTLAGGLVTAISQLESYRERVDQAIALLRGLDL